MKSYTVVGDAPFQGLVKGQEFKADFTEAQEARYIGRGAIELTDGSTPDVDSPEGQRVGEQPASFFDQDDNDNPESDDEYVGDGEKE